MKTIKHTYSYDAYGNLLSEYKRGNGQGQAKEDWAYQYDELNRLVQAHEDHGNQTRNYQYDSLGNLTYEWNSNNVVVDYKLNNLNQITTKSDDKWKTHTDYSYDKRGNNTKKVYYKNKKQTVMGSYVFDESNRMVIGTNDAGEQSIYHFNGLGVLVTNEWITAKNNYGYHDVVPNVEPPEVIIGSSGNNNSNGKGNNGKGNGNNGAGNTNSSGKWSHVIKDFVIDYNSDAEENLMEYERYDEGLTYRYVYGVDKLGVTAYTIANGSASVTTDAGEIPLYYHMDHMGSSEFLTSDVTQRVTSWTSYDEWGNITHNAVLKCGTRELDLVKIYTGHERDSVLGMYYAKARMYDTADKHGSSKGNKLGDKRFTAVDPVKGTVRNPQSLVQYTYMLNNPLMYVDPLGRINYLNTQQREAFTQGLGTGIYQFAGEQWDSIKNIPELPGIIKDLAFDILEGNIDPIELLRVAVNDKIEGAEYLLTNASILAPEFGQGKYTVTQINDYSIKLGRFLGEAGGMVIGAVTGGAAGNAVVKYLNSTGRLKGKLNIVKDYNKKLNCEDATSKNFKAVKREIEAKPSVSLNVKTGTIWDRITVVPVNSGTIREGTAIPYAFYISDINGQTYYFNANATKHLEELVLHNKKINDSSGLGNNIIVTPGNSLDSQIALTAMVDNFEKAVRENGIVYGKEIYSGRWEFVISPPREGERYPVVMHAVLK